MPGTGCRSSGRPSSSLLHPYPGWIDGFKMADPLIIAYGRGILPEFPGLPDSVLDLIPVDLVVNDARRRRGSPGPGQLGLLPRELRSRATTPVPRHVRARARYFHRRCPTRSARTSRCRPGGFPACSAADAAHGRTRCRHGRAGSASDAGVRPDPRLDGLRPPPPAGARGPRTYADLYLSYTQAEVIYDDSRMLALHRALPPGGKRQLRRR